MPACVNCGNPDVKAGETMCGQCGLDPFTPTAAAPGVRFSPSASPPTPAAAPVAAPSPDPKAASRTKGNLVLRCGALSVTFWKSGPVGRDQLRLLGEHVRYVDAVQFELTRTGAGWQVAAPVAKPANETLFNGAPLAGSRQIKEGDVVKVHRLEMAVAFSA